MMDRLKKLNPSYRFYRIEDALFQNYGKRLDYPVLDIMDYVYGNIPLVGSSFHYEADVPDLHLFEAVSQIQKDIFMGANIQFGIIAGYNENTAVFISLLSNKCIIAFMDCAILLRNIQGNDSVCFLLKKGDCIELFPMTLYSIPLHIDLNGFAVGIIHSRPNRFRCANR